MSLENTVFYRLTDENENSCTQLLANIMRTKFVRDIILKFLCGNISDEILDSIRENCIETQLHFFGKWAS